MTNMATPRPWAIGAILLTHVVGLAWIGGQSAPLMDEPAHLASGMYHWRFGRFEPYCVNPPLMRMLASVPAIFWARDFDWDRHPLHVLDRPEFGLGSLIFSSDARRAIELLVLGRWCCLPVSVLGAIVCYRWARELYGQASGLSALICWCFSPIVLAWGGSIMPDVGAAAFGVWAAYRFWRWSKSRDLFDALLAGMAMGLALLAKSTWILIYPLWPCLGLFARRHAGDRGRWSWRSWLSQFALMMAVGTYVLNAGYGFERTGQRLGMFDFFSRSLRGPTATSPSNRFRGTWLEAIPVPFPENFPRGIDLQRMDFEDGKNSYLAGEQKRGGWWYYYLYALAVKTPVGTLALLACALVFSLQHGSRYRGIWRDEVLLLAPAVSVLLLVSSQTGFDRYIRYVLPALPFLFIWMSKAARAFEFSSRKAMLLVTGALACTIGESMFYFPHCLSFFNVLVGGPQGGPAHLLDANIDWGQDLFYLEAWYRRHYDCRPFYVHYFGILDPHELGIEYASPPLRALDDCGVPRSAREIGLKPGWYAISVNE